VAPTAVLAIVAQQTVARATVARATVDRGLADKMIAARPMIDRPLPTTTAAGGAPAATAVWAAAVGRATKRTPIEKATARAGAALAADRAPTLNPVAKTPMPTVGLTATAAIRMTAFRSPTDSLVPRSGIYSDATEQPAADLRKPRPVSRIG
jgi:hypothetical protein